MKRVTGIGGIFLKAKNQKAMSQWYEKHLRLQPDAGGEAVTLRRRHFEDPSQIGMTVWSVFKEDTKYFEPGRASFMINHRVGHVDARLETLRAEGIEIDPKREDYECGRFAWITDLDGNRIELWEPPKQ